MKLLFGCCCPPRVKEEEDGGVNMAERPTASTSLDSVAESRGSVTAVSSDAQRGSPITQEFALARAAVFNDDLRSLDKLVEDDPWLLNASDQFGRTLLIHAALTDRAKVVDWLIRRGSWIETTDRQGRSALHWAVKRNSIKTVRLLLAQKRHSSRSLFLIADADHVTPMHLACRLPSPKCLKIILQHIESDDDCAKMASDDGGRSPLHYAGAHGLSAHLNLLLNDDRLRFSVNQADCIGRTPIMYAVTAASPNAEECVRLLLRRSPLIVSAQDKRGLTPLHL
uniref:Uncharacterized protein n=1 Tax=Plectus sambesii TaxID=2011161 RepID=A0A914UR69_9BILA